MVRNLEFQFFHTQVIKPAIMNIFRTVDNLIYFVAKDGQILHINSAANSYSKNKKDHPQLKSLNIKLNFVPIFICSNRKEMILLGKNEVWKLKNKNEISYSLSKPISLSKQEIRDLSIHGKKLIIEKTDQEKLEYYLQTAAE